MFKQLTAAALLYALTSMPALAQEYVINVHGMVCEFCSYGVAKNLRKLPFIDASKLDDGVRVDIENQRVFIAVRPDAPLDKNALFTAIEKGGYQPITLWAIDQQGKRQAVVQ